LITTLCAGVCPTHIVPVPDPIMNRPRGINTNSIPVWFLNAGGRFEAVFPTGFELELPEVFLRDGLGLGVGLGVGFLDGKVAVGSCALAGLWTIESARARLIRINTCIGLRVSFIPLRKKPIFQRIATTRNPVFPMRESEETGLRSAERKNVAGKPTPPPRRTRSFPTPLLNQALPSAGASL
jgi:hypothetical protein